MARWDPRLVEGTERILARSARPGYPSESVPVDDVDRWVKQVRAIGVKSIICLLNDEEPDNELSYYTQLLEGLLNYYEKEGFLVEHIPITDDQRGWRELDGKGKSIYQAFRKLPKPVLVHCSAGQQRTGRAVDYIVERLRESESAPAGAMIA
jgi:protein tyrosine phosphatase (PTP) superfamily phosphohydrolase (DUF442 family)